nr:hypothetical protein [Tanacetum cinerariifolium]
MDDDQDEKVEEWLMAPVTSPRATVTVPITYEVGGPSTAIPVGHPLTTMASRVATQPQVIDDLCVRMSNLEYRHRELVKKMEIVSDAEADDNALSRKERLKPRRGEASKDLKALAECQTENKNRLDNTSKNNQNQQQPNKRQNTGRAYTARHGEKKHYGGSKPLCSKCNYHHDGPCAPKFHQCNRFGHLARDYRSPVATDNHRNPTCYECGNQGHYRSDCSELKNQDHGNQAGGTEAHGMVHALGRGETNQDLNDVDDDINA